MIKKLDFSYNPETMPDNVFAVLLNEKKLGFLYVSDIGDDGWVEVIYDKITGAKGWVGCSAGVNACVGCSTGVNA